MRTASHRCCADEAVIELEDVGIKQNKTEFLGTMGEWRIAIAGGGIRHKVEKTEGDVTTVLACYDFAENDILMRETFKIDSRADHRQLAGARRRGLQRLLERRRRLDRPISVKMVAADLSAAYIPACSLTPSSPEIPSSHDRSKLRRPCRAIR